MSVNNQHDMCRTVYKRDALPVSSTVFRPPGNRVMKGSREQWPHVALALALTYTPSINTGHFHPEITFISVWTHPELNRHISHIPLLSERDNQLHHVPFQYQISLTCEPEDRYCTGNPELGLPFRYHSEPLKPIRDAAQTNERALLIFTT